MTAIRRVVLVVLDGLRPDAIDRFDLVHLRRLMRCGAATGQGITVSPSITISAMTSLLTGVAPATHGLVNDRIWIPKSASRFVPLATVLTAAGYPTAGFMGDVPGIFRGVATQIGRRLGFGSVHTHGDCAHEILMSAGTTLRTQRRGLIVLHWPDADRAGHAEGWMSDAYALAATRLDGALGALVAQTGVPDDPHTLLIAVADHGGGGLVANDHESEHPLDRTIPIVFAGGGVRPQWIDGARLVDIPATVLAAFGLCVPSSYEGTALELSRPPTPAPTEMVASAVA